MSQEDKSYELKVLKMIMNTYLDKTVVLTEKCLASLEANPDQVAWELATKIYSQSGHKVELSIARDVINSRIVSMNAQLKEARQVVEEAHRVKEEARQGAERKAQLEEARRVATRKAWQSEEDPLLRPQSVFAMVRQIASKKLHMDENNINLNSSLSRDLPADMLDLVEIMMGIEEEFDIDLPDDLDIIKDIVDYIGKKLATPVSEIFTT